MPYPLLADMAIHQFDLARDLIGSEPVWISSESFNPAWSWFAGDAAAQVAAAFADGTRFAFHRQLVQRRPGDLVERQSGGSAVPTAPRCGTATMNRWRRPPTASRSPRCPGPVPRRSPARWRSSSPPFASGSMPSTEVHHNVMSLAMVEGAIRSAQTGQRAVLADLLDEAYEQALATERRPQLRASAGVLAVRARGDRRLQTRRPARSTEQWHEMTGSRTPCSGSGSRSGYRSLIARRARWHAA